MLCEPLDETHIAPRRAFRIVTTLELFEHHFAKTSHSGIPPVTHTLSRPQNYSTATTAATAAPAASFSPPNRKLPPKSGSVRIGDQPDNSTQARFEYAVLSFHALSSGKRPCAVTAVLRLVHFL